MSFEEEFDKIIRRKAEEEKYPFDEGNWEKTSRLLDAERKTTRALNLKKLYLPAALLIILGSAGLITFNYFAGNTDEHIVSVVAKADQQNVNTSDKSNEAQTNIVQKETTQQNNVINNHPASMNKPVESSEPVSNNSSANSDMSAHNSAKIAPEQTEEPISPIKQEKEEIKTVSQNLAGKEPEPAQESIVNTIIPGNQNNSAAENNQNASVSKDNQDEKKSGVDELLLQAGAGSIEQKTEADWLAAVYSNLPFEMSELELMPTPFNILNRYDDDYYKNNQKPRKHYLNAEFGSNYLLGWDTKSGKDGSGFNWFGGFNYGRYLSKKISVSLGIQAYNLGNIQQPFYMNTNKEYGFGSTNSYTVVTSNNLYYLSLPLKFNYAVNSSNIIGFGINAGLLLSSNNTVETYYLLDNQKIPSGPTQKNTGVYQGTRMNNMMLSVHYLTHLTKRFGLNAEFNYGLTDIFKNMGEIQNTERPMGFRLSIQYTLFDK
jgi:hypothetical protein